MSGNSTQCHVLGLFVAVFTVLKRVSLTPPPPLKVLILEAQECEFYFS